MIVQPVRIGALLSYIAIILNLIIGLFFTPWMVHSIGKSNYGLYMLVMSLLTYFIMDYGLVMTIVRYINIYRAEGNEEKVYNLLGLTTKIFLFIDLVLLIALIVIYFFIGSIFKDLSINELEKFKDVYLIAGLFSLLSLPFVSLNGILMAYEKFIWLKLFDIINKTGVVLLMSIAILMGYNLFALIAINSFVGICIIIFKLIYLSKSEKIRVNLNYRDSPLLKDILKISTWVFAIMIGEIFIINITPTILGIFSGTAQIAIFAIGMTLDSYIRTFSGALNGLFFPRVTNLSIHNKSRKEMSDLMIQVGRIQLFIVGFFISAIISLGNQFIELWMGHDFIDSYYVAILLVIPGIIFLTQEIGYTLLFIENKVKYRAIIVIGAALCSIFISRLLAPNFGAIGSSIAISFSLFLSYVLGMNFIYWKVLKLDIPRFFIECHIKLLLPILISILLGFLMQFYIPSNSLLMFIPKALFFGALYILLIWVISLNKYEKGLINDIIQKMVLIVRK